MACLIIVIFLRLGVGEIGLLCLSLALEAVTVEQVIFPRNKERGARHCE
jgi:hypothetical protein